ncbi:hypothetical protein AMECASPLE_019635, partial [Ameca splendens]
MELNMHLAENNEIGSVPLSIHSPPITYLRSQQQTNQQLDQMSSMLQHALNTSPSSSTEVAAASLVSQQLPHSRDVTSPNLERFSCESAASPSSPT